MKNPERIWSTIKEFIRENPLSRFKREDILAKSGLKNASFTSVFQHMCEQQPGGAPRFQERLKGVMTRRSEGAGWHVLSKKGLELYYSETHASTQLKELFEVKKELESKREVEVLPQERSGVLRLIAVRQGQSEFRRQLIEAYQGRCAITGFNCIEALEAAHIRGFGDGGSYAVSNGLLLRCDLHTLFDLNLFAVSPEDHSVVLSDGLKQTVYSQYDGLKVQVPSHRELRPDPSLLMERWREFRGHDI